MAVVGAPKAGKGVGGICCASGSARERLLGGEGVDEGAGGGARFVRAIWTVTGVVVDAAHGNLNGRIADAGELVLVLVERGNCARVQLARGKRQLQAGLQQASKGCGELASWRPWTAGTASAHVHSGPTPRGRLPAAAAVKEARALSSANDRGCCIVSVKLRGGVELMVVRGRGRAWLRTVHGDTFWRQGGPYVSGELKRSYSGWSCATPFNS